MVKKRGGAIWRRLFGWFKMSLPFYTTNSIPHTPQGQIPAQMPQPMQR